MLAVFRVVAILKGLKGIVDRAPVCTVPPAGLSVVTVEVRGPLVLEPFGSSRRNEGVYHIVHLEKRVLCLLTECPSEGFPDRLWPLLNEIRVYPPPGSSCCALRISELDEETRSSLALGEGKRNASKVTLDLSGGGHGIPNGDTMGRALPPAICEVLLQVVQEIMSLRGIVVAPLLEGIEGNVVVVLVVRHSAF